LWPITGVAARRAGSYRHAFARRGVQLTTADTLIAAVARTARATLVTRNRKDFPMNDILVHPL
jgi:predicted nucleic acid-binding protein